MLHLYVFSFVAGAVFTNGVPHFVKGITGQKHHTPFGRPSSAVVNVVYGWVSLVVGGFLLHLAHPRTHILRASVCFVVGSLAIAVLLAYSWSRHPEHSK